MGVGVVVAVDCGVDCMDELFCDGGGVNMYQCDDVFM